jgi:hypothetical protein
MGAMGHREVGMSHPVFIYDRGVAEAGRLIPDMPEHEILCRRPILSDKRQLLKERLLMPAISDANLPAH